MAATKRARRRHTRAIVVTGAIVVVAVAGYFAYRATHSTASVAVRYTTEAAQKMTLTTSVSGTGNVVLGTSATVSPSVSGTVSGLTVKVGDKVTKGQLLFTLVNPELDLAVQNAENSYNQAVNSLSQAKLSVLQAEKNLSDLETQRASQTSSAAEVASAIEPSSTIELASATEVASAAELAGFTNADGAHQTASSGAAIPVELGGAVAEAPTPAVSDSSTAMGTTTDTSANPTPDSSTTNSSTPESGSTTESTSTTEPTPTTNPPASTTTTQTSIPQGGVGSTTTTTKTITALDIEVAEQQVTTAELAVASAQTQIESAELTLQQAKDNAAARNVAAPIDGTVTTLSISNGDALGSTASGGASTGSSAGGGSATGSTTGSSSSSSAMVITDLSSFEASVTLAEADIASVAIGQKATLTFDALPNLTLTGKVKSVDDSGTVSQGVVSYTVAIVPDVANDGVKGGMTVTAEIITSVTADALVVPSTAVKSDSSGAKYVQILKNGAPVDQTVEVGVSTDTYTQITSGLTEGQEVITQTINPSASSTSTTSRSNGNSLLNGGGAPLDNGGGAPPSGAPSGF